LPFDQEEQVLVPAQGGEGKVRATVITPAEAGRRPRFAWVRIAEGPEQGDSRRVAYSDIEYPEGPRDPGAAAEHHSAPRLVSGSARPSGAGSQPLPGT